MEVVSLSADMLALSEILRRIQEEHGLRLNRPHLMARSLTGSEGAPESHLERLERMGLARAAQHGQRRLWYVHPDAIPHLVELARTARPGPAPGAQVTLDAQQLTVFARHLAESADPAEAVREAAAAATGLDPATIERVVIPASPRRPAGALK